MLNRYSVCKHISVLYYIFESGFGTILKFSYEKYHCEEQLIESAFTKGFNLILYIFKGKQGI